MENDNNLVDSDLIEQGDVLQDVSRTTSIEGGFSPSDVTSPEDVEALGEKVEEEKPDFPIGINTMTDIAPQGDSFEVSPTIATWQQTNQVNGPDKQITPERLFKMGQSVQGFNTLSVKGSNGDITGMGIMTLNDEGVMEVTDLKDVEYGLLDFADKLTEASDKNTAKIITDSLADALTPAGPASTEPLPSTLNRVIKAFANEGIMDQASIDDVLDPETVTVEQDPINIEETYAGLISSAGQLLRAGNDKKDIRVAILSSLADNKNFIDSGTATQLQTLSTLGQKVDQVLAATTSQVTMEGMNKMGKALDASLNVLNGAIVNSDGEEVYVTPQTPEEIEDTKAQFETYKKDLASLNKNAEGPYKQVAAAFARMRQAGYTVPTEKQMKYGQAIPTVSNAQVERFMLPEYRQDWEIAKQFMGQYNAIQADIQANGEDQKKLMNTASEGHVVLRSEVDELLKQSGYRVEATTLNNPGMLYSGVLGASRSPESEGYDILRNLASKFKVAKKMQPNLTTTLSALQVEMEKSVVDGSFEAKYGQTYLAMQQESKRAAARKVEETAAKVLKFPEDKVKWDNMLSNSKTQGKDIVIKNPLASGTPWEINLNTPDGIANAKDYLFKNYNYLPEEQYNQLLEPVLEAEAEIGTAEKTKSWMRFVPPLALARAQVGAVKNIAEGFREGSPSSEAGASPQRVSAFRDDAGNIVAYELSDGTYEEL